MIGRSAECDVVVAQASVSSRHCALMCKGDEVVQLRDLGSTNGTFLGGVRVAGEELAAANDGSIIALGSNDGPAFSLHRSGHGGAAAPDRVVCPAAPRSETSPGGVSAAVAAAESAASPAARAASPPPFADLGREVYGMFGLDPAAAHEGPRAVARGPRHFPTPEWKRERDAAAAAATADARGAPAQPDPQEAFAGAQAVAIGAGRWCIIDESTEDVVEIVPGFPLTLGSGGGCDVVLEGKGVREEHCRIRDAVPRRLRRKTTAPPSATAGQAAAVELLDLGSAGGTLLNGTRLALGGSAPLKAGDVVALASPRGPRLLVRGPRTGDEEQMEAGASGAKRSLVDADAEDVAAPRRRRCKGPEAAVVPQANLATASECAGPSVGELGDGASVGDVAAVLVEAIRDLGAGVGTPRLVDLTSGRRRDLIPNSITTVGRKGDCEVLVDSPWVSGRHCMLFCGSDGSVELEDLSTNGTWVNDTRVPKGVLLPQRVGLHQGDSIALGSADRPIFMVLFAVQAETLAAAGA